ncbi:XTP/dITP diphosphohydrolase [Pseudobutyrivibrio sp. YE44]|uniref:RdgB/HAM1 family non-canonical purine NTP pyrophosphatase n=1 Tax=Pseudobutyrivibrio sp. YE44 TaxID=1520802 RepID=UPI0008801614|nr:RdgB/HAM1 family non-canonical purine NTP pyrophosphatase [Pseudobutyrivibrio sp. YE44]SDB49674.1 XTP/dITP diphosphohydrolase [Pseudobutyrivibrio sp. YE44]
MNKTKIVFATGNVNKMREIKAILGEDKYDIQSMKEAGVDCDIVEDGKTFEENSLIKSRAISKLVPDAIVLADDSGLEIDALNKEPGIYSARYLGEDTSYDVKNANLIQRLEGVEKQDRSARFVCAVSAVFPDGKEAVVRGTIEGYIGWEPMGTNGFGYDPIFYLWDKDVSTASVSPEEKNAISHRGQALRMIKEEIIKHENISC